MTLTNRLLALLACSAMAFAFTGCDDDDDDGATGGTGGGAVTTDAGTGGTAGGGGEGGTGGTAGEGGEGGEGGAIEYSEACIAAATILAECAESDEYCPGISAEDHEVYYQGLLDGCVANPILASVVSDCGAIATVSGLNPEFLDSCENGIDMGEGGAGGAGGTEGDPCTDCLMTECGAEVNDCFVDELCMGGYACLGEAECAADDEACIGACLPDDATASDLFLAMIQCVAGAEVTCADVCAE